MSRKHQRLGGERRWRALRKPRIRCDALQAIHRQRLPAAALHEQRGNGGHPCPWSLPNGEHVAALLILDAAAGRCHTQTGHDDGFMWWNILDPVLGVTPAPSYYPVLRSMNGVGD